MIKDTLFKNVNQFITCLLL